MGGGFNVSWRGKCVCVLGGGFNVSWRRRRWWYVCVGGGTAATTHRVDKDGQHEDKVRNQHQESRRQHRLKPHVGVSEPEVQPTLGRGRHLVSALLRLDGPVGSFSSHQLFGRLFFSHICRRNCCTGINRSYHMSLRVRVCVWGGRGVSEGG